jgi:DNA-directed RNA polymerase specialized sigma24 family protein
MIIEPILPTTREQLFVSLYESAFPKAASFIRKMGGNLDEAKDIFQDALVIYYEKNARQEFLPEQNETAYLLGICKHLWYKTHKAHSKEEPLNENLRLSEEPEPNISDNVLRFVERSGKKCMELLKAFYYDKLSMKELAGKFSFSGERSATAQKYKCLEKVRTAIQERSLNKEDFYE